MNEHITENLENYLTIEKPQYAVLLSGKWGSGKTFFIDGFLKSKQSKDKKFIKISLFGLKHISEVNNKIILQLLNIEKKWVGQIAKAAQSYTKKLNLPIQDLPIDKIFNKFNKELIFIFDDLERSNMQQAEILGYINYFVEQSNFKVIILADDTKITDDEFTKFKEKVIGKTFEIKQDFDAVLTVFLDLATNSKEALRENKQHIKDIYNKAKYNNLRHIRQTILDFEYFYEHIDNKFTKNDDFLRDIICIFFAFSIEVKKGELKIGEISKNIKFFIDKDRDKDEEETTNLTNILAKYSIINDNYFNDIFGEISLLIGKENWENILFKGNIIKDDINTAISQTIYFAKYNRESWVKLWYFRDLEDEEFKVILADVVEKFNNNKYLEHEKLLHVVALLLFLSKNVFNDDTTQADILTRAKNNINTNAKTPYWQQNGYKHDYVVGAYSLGYMDEKSNKFREVITYLENKSQEAFNVGLEAKANTLLQDFENNDIEALKAKLALRDLNNIAIFSQINVADFINILLKVKHTNLGSIFAILERRYQDCTELTQDLEFWQGVDNSLLGKIDKDKQPLKYSRMEAFKNYTLKDIITILTPQASE